MSLAIRLTAVLIASLFFGATVQCTSLCAKPEASVAQQVPPCHQHHNSCAKATLTAQQTVAVVELSVPTLTLLPVGFITCPSVVPAVHSRPAAHLVVSPPDIAHSVIVLRI